MEKSDIRNLWKEYRGLEEKKQLSGTIIKKMIRERSHSELAGIVRIEYSSLAVFFGLIVLFIVSLSIYGDDWRFRLVGIGGLIISFAGLVWTIYFIRRIRAINFSRGTFVQVSSGIAAIRRLLRRERVAQVIVIPFFLACIFPVMYMLVQKLNIFEEFNRVAFRVTFAYVLLTVATLWIYKYYYFRKLEVVERNVKEEELEEWD